MILLSAIVGIAAAALLLTAGYLFGIKRGFELREDLRRQDAARAQDLKQLRERLSLRTDEANESLKASIEQMLSPLMQRERLSVELAHLDGRSGQSGLTDLLDQIAEKGNFTAVLLSDNQGWPLAASANTRDADRLSITASLMLLAADRIGRDGAPTPMSLMMLDGTNMVTLCRIFHVDEHRLALTAVSPGAQLTPTALDPALGKIDAVLSKRDQQGAAAAGGPAA